MAAALLGNFSEPRAGEPARMGIISVQFRQASRELQQFRQACDVTMMRLLGVNGDMDALTSQGESESASVAFLTLAGEQRSPGIVHAEVPLERLVGESWDAASPITRALPPGNLVGSITTVDSFQRIDTMGICGCPAISELGMPKAAYLAEGKRQPLSKLR